MKLLRRYVQISKTDKIKMNKKDKRTAEWNQQSVHHKHLSGSVLLSQAVASQVPSALEGLTSVFGMGTGGTPPPSPPESFQMSFDNHTS